MHSKMRNSVALGFASMISLSGCTAILRTAADRNPDAGWRTLGNLVADGTDSYNLDKAANNSGMIASNSVQVPNIEANSELQRIENALRSRNLERTYRGVELKILNSNREEVAYPGTMRLYDDAGIFVTNDNRWHFCFSYNELENVTSRVFPLGGNIIDIDGRGEPVRFKMWKDSEANELNSYLNSKKQ